MGNILLRLILGVLLWGTVGSTADAEAPVTFGVLDVRGKYDPSSFLTFGDAMFLHNTLGTLVHTGPNNEIYGFLAEKWEISNGGVTYRFHIHPKAKFSNGEPVTAQDVVNTFKRAILYGVQYGDFKQFVKGAETLKSMNEEVPGLKVLSKLVLEVTLNSPQKDFMNWLAVRELGILRSADSLLKPFEYDFKVTSGPFSLLSKKEGEVILRRNPFFHLSVGNDLRDIRLVPITADTDYPKMFRSKTLDLVEPGIPMNPDMGGLLAENLLDVTSSQSFAVLSLSLNSNRPAFSKKQYRNWFASLVSAQELIPFQSEKVFTPADQILMEHIAGALSANEAKAILAKHRQKGGGERPPVQELTLLYQAHFGKKYEKKIVAYLESKLGMKIRVTSVDRLKMNELAKKKSFDLHLHICGLGDRSAYPIYSYHLNPPLAVYGFSSPEISKLMLDASKLSVGERESKMREVSRVLLEQSFFVPIAYSPWLTLHRKGLFFKDHHRSITDTELWKLSTTKLAE